MNQVTYKSNLASARAEKTLITITILMEGNRHDITTYAGEYRSLMVLIYDKFYMEDFGECRGIGRCGTCHIKVLNKDHELLMRAGNENTTLNRMDAVSSNSRLACQIVVDEKLDGLVIEVVTQLEQ